LTNIKRFSIFLISILFIFSIKIKYGGELSILLNEPVDFNFSETNYSNSIFYSFIHENFFYMKNDGTVYSNIFKNFSFDETKNKVLLEIKENSCFSNGSPIHGKNIHYSLKVFFNRENYIAKKISRSVKKIETGINWVAINLNYKIDNIFQLLSSPELVVLSMNENAFSGMLTPDEWERKKFIKLVPNRYFPGGHVYLDRVNVIFNENTTPDVFLSEPNSVFSSYRELKGGVYQNIFLTFPMGKTGKNTRIALYSFLNVFFKKSKLEEISSLTSDNESPVSVKITQFSMRKIRMILRNSKFKLYVNSSLKKYQDDLNAFIKSNSLKISLVFIKNIQLREFTGNGTIIKFYLTEKLFSSITPHVDKIKKIIFELTFSRFNERYLKLVNELDELRYMENNELLMDKLSNVIELLINKEYILPLNQKRFSIFIKDKFKNIFIDYYGRPIFTKIRLK